MNCEIVKDLIPLVIDNAASEESTAAVNEHLTACEQCQKICDVMRNELKSSQFRENRGESFARMAKQIKHFRFLKRILCVLVCLVLCGGLIYHGSNFVRDRRYLLTESVAKELYDINLSRLADGSVSVNTDWHGTKDAIDMNYYSVEEDTGLILYFYAIRAAWPVKYPEPVKNFSVVQLQLASHSGNNNIPMDSAAEVSEKPIIEIRLGTEYDFKTVWKAGDSIPDASMEMEQYFAYWAEIKKYEHTDGIPFQPSDEDLKRWNNLNEMSLQVPEWNKKSQ